MLSAALVSIAMGGEDKDKRNPLMNDVSVRKGAGVPGSRESLKGRHVVVSRDTDQQKG